MKKIYLLLSLFMVSITYIIHAQDSLEINPEFSGKLLFAGKMLGSAEIPQIDSEGLGVAGILFSEDMQSAFVNVSLNGLSSSITGLHLHEANSDNNGSVIYNLTSFVNNNRVSTQITDFDPTLIIKLLSGDVYINAHTSNHPSGEIRAQLLLESDVNYSAELSGANEVPAVESNGKGLASINLTKSLNTLELNAIVDGLSGPITGAHLHMASSGSNGGVVLNLKDFINGNTIRATFDSVEIVEALDAGDIYLNIHTSANPSGEIRGQLHKSSGISFDTWMTGSKEVPSNGSEGIGLAVAQISSDLTTIEVKALTNNLGNKINSAHFHNAAQGSNGGVILNFAEAIDSNYIDYSGTITNAALIPALLSGKVYINAHTAIFPSGELRGQMYGLIRDAYSFDLCQDQESTIVFPAQKATGGAILSLDRKGTNLHLMSVVSGLSQAVTGIHIHGAAIGSNGGVILSLTDQYSNGGVFTSYLKSDLNSTIGKAIRDTAAYLNVHTSNNLSGEVRGQIVREPLCPIQYDVPSFDIFNPNFSSDILVASRLSGGNEVPQIETEGLGVATLTFNDDFTSAVLNATVSNLSSPVTGVHIHLAPIGENGSVIVNLTEMYNEGRITGSFEIDSALLFNILSGRTYLNIHTENNPGGEIRGQLYVDAAESFNSRLRSENSDFEGEGLASIHYTEATNTLEINFIATNLTGPITAIHLHNAPPGSNGGVVENLISYLDGNTIHAKIDAGTYIDELRAGNIYINIHTAANPGGEIRGNLNQVSGLAFDSWMTGNQQIPIADNLTIGLTSGYVSNDLSTMYFDAIIHNPTDSLTAAHFHKAALGSSGSVVLNVTDKIEGNYIGNEMGIAINSEQLDALLDGSLYLNVHTGQFPAGEVRGQIYRLARDGYAYDLCQNQVVNGANDSGNSAGSGMFSLNRNWDEAHFMVVVNELSSDFTNAHIHNAPEGENGGVAYGFADKFSNNGAFIYLSAEDLTEDLVNIVQAGNAYVNIHTSNNPGGELRGQIIKEPNCPLETAVVQFQDHVSELNVFPNPSSEYLNVRFGVDNDFAGSVLNIFDLNGRLVFTKTELSLEERINIADFEKGIYILKFSNVKYTHKLKFVKL